MSDLVKQQLRQQLLRPGGYKLKSQTFIESTLRLERERAALSAMYQRVDEAKDEIVDMLKLLDPMIYEYLTMVTGGRTRYAVGGLSAADPVILQDNMLRTLSAAGICLQLATMAAEESAQMDECLAGVSTAMSELERDASTQWARQPLGTLVDVTRSEVLAADILGVGKADQSTFVAPKRPAAMRASPMFGEPQDRGDTDKLTPPPFKHSRRRQGASSQAGQEITSVQGGSSLALIRRDTSAENLDAYFRT